MSPAKEKAKSPFTRRGFVHPGVDRGGWCRMAEIGIRAPGLPRSTAKSVRALGQTRSGPPTETALILVGANADVAHDRVAVAARGHRSQPLSRTAHRPLMAPVNLGQRRSRRSTSPFRGLTFRLVRCAAPFTCWPYPHRRRW